MADEGKVASLFVEFRATVDKFAADIQQMSNSVRELDTVVKSTVTKSINDLGNQGSAAVDKLVADLGNLTSGISTANTYTQQLSKGVADLGLIGSASVKQLNNDLANLTAGLKTANTFTQQLSTGVSKSAAARAQEAAGPLDLGQMFGSSAALNQVTASVNNLVSGISTANTYVAQASKGVTDFGHLGSAAIAEVSNDIGGLTAGLSTANTYVQQSAKGVSDFGHLGSAAVQQVSNDIGGLTSGLNTANTYVAQATKGVSDLGHLGSTAINQVTAATVTLSGRLEQASNDLRQFERSFAPISQAVNNIGIALSVGLTAPLVAATAYVVKTGVTFESAFAGVRKTVQASEEEFANLRAELIKLSTAAPVSAAEFAKIAQAAGELGLKAPQIAGFAQTVAELTATTRLSSDEATNFLGRFSNITQLDPSKIHNVASTLVALGHGFAASEAEIAAFSLRIARVGSFVGLSQADILAFSAALASVGLTAEAGGSAITRVFADIATAVAAGGTKLKQFASVAQVPFDQFRDLFKADPSAAVGAYIDGLKRINKEGGDVFSTLKALGESNIRVRDTLLALAKAEDQLTNGLAVSRNEMVKNGELIRAYGERNKTTESQVAILRYQVDALAIDLFGTLAPAINNGIIPAMKKLVEEGIKPIVDGFIALPPSMQLAIGGVLTLAAVLGPAILLFNKLYRTIEETKIILKALTADTFLAEASFAGLGTAVTILAAVFAGWEIENKIIDLLGLRKQFDDVKASAGELGEAILRLTKAWGGNQIKQFITDIENLGKAMGIALPSIRAVAIALILPRLIQSGLEIKGLIAFMNGMSDAMKTADEKTKDWSDSLSNSIQNTANATAFSNNLSIAMDNVGKAAKNAGGGTPGPDPEALKAAQIAADKLAKEMDALLKKFKETLSPADTLNKELDFLLKTFSDDQVVAAYAKKIVDAGDAQSIMAGKVTGNTARLLEQARAAEKVGQILKDLGKEDIPTFLQTTAQFEPSQGPGLPKAELPNLITPAALKSFLDANKQIRDLGEAVNALNFGSASVQAEVFSGDLDKAAKSAFDLKIPLSSNVLLLLAQKQSAEEAAKGLKTWQDAADEGGKKITEMAGQIEGATQSVEKLDQLGLADAQILKILGDTIEKAGENAKTLRTELQPLIDRLVKLQGAMKDSTKEAKEFDKIIDKAVADIVNHLTTGIADALTGSKSFAELGKNLAKDFAEAFIRAATSSIAAALTKKLADLAKSHPVVAAVAAAVLIVVDIVKLLGNSHLFANQFVKETQDPFGKSLTQFVNTSNALYAAGRQTYEGAVAAQGKVQELWQGFLDDAAEFGKQGRKQATVAQQAIETLTPTFTRVIYGIQQQIDSLKPPSIRAIEFVDSVNAYRNGIAALTEERIAELNAEAVAINDQIQFTMKQIATQEEMGGSTAELNAQLQELIYQWDAVQDALHPVIPELYDFATAVAAISGKLVPDKTEQFLDSVLNATSGAGNLEEALGILESIHTPVAIILDRLGSDIESFYQVLTASGLPIPDLIEKYHKLAVASKQSSDGIPKIANSLSKLVGDAVDKLRQIAGGGDLAQSILDALARLLTGLPAPGTGTSASPVKDAVDKLAVITQNILLEIQKITKLPAAPDTRVAAADIGRSSGNFISTNLPGISGVVPVVSQVNIYVTDNGVITNQFTFTDQISRAAVRGSVIPEITEALNNNTDSSREKWTRILGSSWNGVVTK